MNITTSAVLLIVASLWVGSASAQVSMPAPHDSGGSIKPIMIPANPDLLKKLSPIKDNTGVQPFDYTGPCNSAYACVSGEVIICGPGGRPVEYLQPYSCECERDACGR